MADSLLKKEFKQRDVNRARNLVKKNFTGKTVVGIGYQKQHIAYKEGDVWEENGKNWTIKDGIKQNITKLDAAKKALRIPLTCPKCSNSMKYYLHQKMYKIHKMCFDCVIDYEATLRKAGLYEQYEKTMMQGSIEAFTRDIEQWVLERISTVDTYVTEQGDVEDWKSNTQLQNKKVYEDMQKYLTYLKDHLNN